jgi:hypothetical protein
MLKSAISSSGSKNKKTKSFFGILTIGSCPRLLGEHVDKQTLTAHGAKILNYATLSFCTIVMHIMLDTCVPNLRGR